MAEQTFWKTDLNPAGQSEPFGWLSVLCAGADFEAGDSANERLKQARAAFRSLVDNLPLNFIIKDTSGRRVFANQQYLDFHDTSLQSILGKTDFDLFPEDLARKYTADDAAVIHTGRVLHDLEAHQTRDGRRQWVERIKGPLRDAQGNIVGVQVLFWDVTERRQMEQELDRERYLLHSLMDNIPDAIYFKDRNSRFLRISRALAEKFGLGKAEEYIGKTDADVFTEEHARAALADEREIIRTGRPMVARIEKETWPNREDTWVSTTKMPLLDNEGRIVGTFGISRDITELKRTQDELRRARDAADAASRAKSDFLANMSHEIRTPLNALIGMTELLLDTRLTPTQRDYLEIVQQSGESLLDLLNDVLDFSKIEAGRVELIRAPFHLRDRLGDTMKALAVRAHGKGLELACAIDPDVPEVLVGDAGRLRQVVVNLVGNAIKFTEEGEVLLDVRCQSQSGDQVTLLFSVRDTGIGIPPEKQSQIFGVFEQGDPSTTRSYGGTGLGLAIAARLVELMNGQIHVESEPGRGSSFSFAATFGVADLVQEEQPDRSTMLSGIRALIVDDNATNRRILFDILTTWRLKPAAAASADEALQALREAAQSNTPFQIALLDVNMPKVDGFELANRIRHDPSLAKTPLIMLTSADRPGDADRHTALKIDGCLLKPVKQSELFDLILSVTHVSAGYPNEGQSAAGAPPDVRGLRVLLAEDHPINQKLAVAVLEKLGCRVTVASDGREAVAACREQPFDAVLMDVQMPIMDGFEAARSIRREEEPGRRTPIIAITAHTTSSDRKACLQAGMDDYVTKPMRMVQLANKLAAVGKKKPASSGAPPSAPCPEAHINWGAALEALGGDMSLLKIIVDTFLDESEMLLERIGTSIQKADATLLKESAHLMKGALLAIGANRVAKVASELQQLGREGNLASAGDRLETLDRELAVLVPILQQGPPWPRGDKRDNGQESP